MPQSPSRNDPVRLPPLPPPPELFRHPPEPVRSSSTIDESIERYTRRSSVSTRFYSTHTSAAASDESDTSEDGRPIGDNGIGNDLGKKIVTVRRRYVEEREVNGKVDGTMKRITLLSKHRIFVKAEVKMHAGVFVVVKRGRPEVELEAMPLASRVGCQLLYHGVLGHEKLLDSDRVEKIFRKWSIREGKKFDSPINALHRIQGFVRAYHIDLHDLLEPDLSRYATLNRFFFRKLRPNARPIDQPKDPDVVSSAADCRLTVFRSVSSAQKLWIKGRHFSLDALLGNRKLAEELRDGCVAIFRLAPADYHRFHSPVDATVGSTKHIAGKYYTVNSLVVRDERFNPLGENKRDVTRLSCHRPNGSDVPVAFCQIGALLVSSIRQTVLPNTGVSRGDELGYFAYGGSTIVVVFPKDSVEWDRDVLANSEGRNERGLQLETMVKVGERIGRWR